MKSVTNYALYAVCAIGVIAAVAACTIFSKTDHLKNVYGIKNVKTGKGLRPYNAYWWTGNKVILHDYNNWKCMTWQFLEVEPNTFQLQNLSTKKTFEASSDAQAGVTQQRLQKSTAQYWEFISQGDQSYLIRQKGTDLYLTISSEQTNSAIVLEPKLNSDEQLWRLVEQHPWQ